MTHLEAFRAAMTARGLRHTPDRIEPGRLYRCASSDKAGDMAGWFKLFPDGIGGVFGDWREGWQETWQAPRDKPLTTSERESFRRHAKEAAQQREAEADAERAAAARRAADIWDAAASAPVDHPYLSAKGVKPHGLRSHEGSLVVPVRSGTDLHSLQFIAIDGSKRFLSGGRVAGGYYSIGKPNGALCIAEGFATAASIYEATGLAVAVAFNAGNLLPVAAAMREKFPALRIILCADDDAGTEGNPGMIRARAAAAAVGGLLAVPDFGANRLAGVSDFNDLAKCSGAAAVRACIERAEQVRPDAECSVDRAILVRCDAIKPEPITWLWPDWIAAGKLHILAGAPGTAKTTLALALAAAVTSGGVWPDRTRATPGDVVMWSGEDSAEDVLVPRALAMGANPLRLHIVRGIIGPEGNRPYDPARDTSALSDALRDLPAVRLLIVDPIVSAVAGDSHHNAETRRSLQPLVDLAQEHDCALLGITHLSKGSAGRDPVERVTGSLAFGALARVVLMTAREQRDDDTPGRRLLLRAKSNIGPDTGGFAYALVQDTLASYPGVIASSVRWGDPVEGTARELMAQAEEVDDSTADDSKDFLRSLLSAGARPAKEVYAEAEGAGYSRDAMKRAKARIGATAKKQGMSGGWLWCLPDAEGSEGRSRSSVLSSHPLEQDSLPSGADWVEL